MISKKSDVIISISDKPKNAGTSYQTGATKEELKLSKTTKRLRAKRKK